MLGYARSVMIIAIPGGIQMRALVILFLLLSPSLATAADVAGLWVGYYAYEPGAAVERVECAMVLEQLRDEIGGTMIERQTFGDELLPGLPAFVLGAINGNQLSFDKRYAHEDDDAATVVYRMTISADGNTFSGSWTVGDIQGTAYFRRVTAASVKSIPVPR